MVGAFLRFGIQHFTTSRRRPHQDIDRSAQKTNTRQSIIGATEKRHALKSFDFSFFSTGCAVCPLVRSRDIRCHPCVFVSIDTTHVVTKLRML
jgi:hypothetical protein